MTLPVAIEQCIEGSVQKYLIRQAIENGYNSHRLHSAEKARLTELLEMRGENAS